MTKIYYFLTIALLLCSCASHDVTYRSNLTYNIEAQENKVAENGIVLMAKPVLIKSELELYYDEDLLKYGILPVQVYLSNNSEDGIYFLTEEIILKDPLERSYQVVPVNSVVDKAEKSYWRAAGWGLLTYGIGAIPSVNNVRKTNKVIREDYESKALKSTIIPKGASTEGTVFFEVPKDIVSVDQWELKLAYKTPNDNDLSIIGLRFVGQIEKRGSNTISESNSDIN